MDHQSINESAVRDLATAWFRMLDQHAPVTELLPLLAEDGLVMNFPEGKFHGQGDFEKWYVGVTHVFFDEVHALRSVRVNPASGETQVVVHWEASRWQAPAAKSERILLDAYQTWVVQSSQSGKPVIATYTVDRFEYQDGSARL
jgi:hypothetical protein